MGFVDARIFISGATARWASLGGRIGPANPSQAHPARRARKSRLKIFRRKPLHDTGGAGFWIAGDANCFVVERGPRARRHARPLFAWGAAWDPYCLAPSRTARPQQ